MAGRGLVRVGVREFREDLAQYLESPVPIAVTRHGHTVGYYIPARGEVDERELLALRRAAAQMEALLAEHGISEDEVVREFQARRRES
ncbi:MAG: type II toxin-antitoxin system Phd/YefM family antitoxin [Dehalococcoidia bacterium]